MTIIYDPKFISNFNDIWDRIALDSKTRANKFKKNIKATIENIPFMPYKYRKSIFFDDENIRDMIFKGYVTPYKIDTTKNIITILGIKKYKNSF
jgi:plasmid stabilization system protein ParE